MRNILRSQILLCLACLLPAAAPAAEPAEATAGKPDLRTEILRADEELFDAFNRADVDTMGKIFAPDLEFYQDDEGLANYRQTLDDLREMFARSNGTRRELDDSTVEIRPIKGFGAVEIGTHRFCHREYAQDICGEFRFVHIWRNTSGQWQLARVISYGHKIED